MPSGARSGPGTRSLQAELESLKIERADLQESVGCDAEGGAAEEEERGWPGGRQNPMVRSHGVVAA